MSLEEQEKKIKAEKMRIALEKMKAASFQKVRSSCFNNIILTSTNIFIGKAKNQCIIETNVPDMLDRK